MRNPGVRRFRRSCPEPPSRPRPASRRTEQRAPVRLVPQSYGPFPGYPFRRRQPPPHSLLREQTPAPPRDRCRLPLLSQIPLFLRTQLAPRIHVHDESVPGLFRNNLRPRVVDSIHWYLLDLRFDSLDSAEIQHLLSLSNAASVRSGEGSSC